MSNAIYRAAGAGFVIGFGGDLFLNFLTQKVKVLDAGLIEYFPLHRTLEAAFIAGGLIALSVFVALYAWEYIMSEDVLKINYWYTLLYLFIFGAILDNFFRFLHLMPTLNGMYKKLSPPISMLFAGGPIAASYVLYYFLH